MIGTSSHTHKVIEMTDSTNGRQVRLETTIESLFILNTLYVSESLQFEVNKVYFFRERERERERNLSVVSSVYFTKYIYSTCLGDRKVLFFFTSEH